MIRGNASEILGLSGAAVQGRGADAADPVAAAEAAARDLALQSGATVAVTGAVDYVTDGTRAVHVTGRHPMMTRVMVLGLSVDAEAQVAAIPKGCVTYLGVGPVRVTASKPDHAPPFGFAGLARIAAAAGLPCMAIGGLVADDVAAVRAAGCAGIAVVSVISRAADPQASARNTHGTGCTLSSALAMWMGAGHPPPEAARRALPPCLRRAVAITTSAS